MMHDDTHIKYFITHKHLDSSCQSWDGSNVWAWHLLLVIFTYPALAAINSF